MILGKNSLPEPLSPVTSTERSMGATFMARSMAAINAGLSPMMEKRCFTRRTSSLMSALREGVLMLSVIYIGRGDGNAYL